MPRSSRTRSRASRQTGAGDSGSSSGSTEPDTRRNRRVAGRASVHIGACARHSFSQADIASDRHRRAANQASHITQAARQVECLEDLHDFSGMLHLVAPRFQGFHNTLSEPRRDDQLTAPSAPGGEPAQMSWQPAFRSRGRRHPGLWPPPSRFPCPLVLVMHNRTQLVIRQRCEQAGPGGWPRQRWHPSRGPALREPARCTSRPPARRGPTPRKPMGPHEFPRDEHGPRRNKSRAGDLDREHRVAAHDGAERDTPPERPDGHREEAGGSSSRHSESSASAANRRRVSGSRSASLTAKWRRAAVSYRSTR